MQIIHSLQENEDIEAFKADESLRAPWIRFSNSENSLAVFWASPQEFKDFVTMLNNFEKKQQANDLEPTFNHLVYVKRNSCSGKILREIYTEEIL